MRPFVLILICCLSAAQRTQAMEFFGDVLYWQATEPVDWTLDTNHLPTNQYVAYHTVDYDFAPGFRVGVGTEGDWGAKFYYTRFHVSATDSASGNLTPAFLGGKQAVPSDSILNTPFYFDEGRVRAAIDYNVLDLDLGPTFYLSDSLQARPVVGLRGAWIDQSFESVFQGTWPGFDLSKTTVERMKNDFWGIGPKVGLETEWNLCRSEAGEINVAAHFYTSFLLGHWSVSDVTTSTGTFLSVPYSTTSTIPIDSRDFGALSFQVVLGVHLKYGRWSGTIGYEINDWLNQCQVFDDATGPHNNDLLLQGLTASFGCSF